MNTRDHFFYQAVVYAKEKNNKAARAMLRNLLYQYPDDVESLLLYSIVAPTPEISLQALKRVLLIDPDHEVAFEKISQLKYAPPSSIPTPTAPLPIPPAIPAVKLAPRLRANERNAPHRYPPKEITPPPPQREKIEKEKISSPPKRKKIKPVEITILVLLGLATLCVFSAIAQRFVIYLLAGFQG